MTDWRSALMLFGLAAVTVGGLWLSWWLRRRELRQLQRGDWRGATAFDVSQALSSSYLRGDLDPALLDRARTLPAPWFFPSVALNTFICLDVAAGRRRGVALPMAGWPGVARLRRRAAAARS